MNYFRRTVLGVAFILLITFEASLAQSTAKSNSSKPLRLTVTVTGDDRKPAAGLPQHLFTVSDDTGVREILSFSNEDVPIRELEDLASLTGGTTYSPTNVAELRTSLEQLALELRQQYSIDINFANDVSGGKWRSLKVKVATPLMVGLRHRG